MVKELLLKSGAMCCSYRSTNVVVLSSFLYKYESVWRAENYLVVVYYKRNYLYNCVAFVDGTVVVIVELGGNIILQRFVNNGQQRM